MSNTDLKPRAPGKPPLALLPVAGLEVAASAFEHGALKYWPNNWRGCPADEIATYRHAMLRHCIAFCNNDERDDPESGVSHLGHIIACAMIMAHVLELSYRAPSFAQEYPERRGRLISDAALFGPQPAHPNDVKANPDAYLRSAIVLPVRDGPGADSVPGCDDAPQACATSFKADGWTEPSPRAIETAVLGSSSGERDE